MQGISSSLVKDISKAIAEGMYKVDDNKQAIVVCFGGRRMEALVMAGDGLNNVHFSDKDNKSAVRHLYNAYKESQIKKPVVERDVVKIFDGGKTKDKKLSGSRVDGLFDAGKFKDKMPLSTAKAGKHNLQNMDEFKTVVQNVYKLRAEVGALTKEIVAKNIMWNRMGDAEGVMNETPDKQEEVLKVIKKSAEEV